MRPRPTRNRSKIPPSQVETKIPKKFKLTNVAKERQRLNISNRATATIVNAFVKDMGISDKVNIIDQHKIARETSKQNKALEQSHKNQISQFLTEIPCFGLYFDGKKDKTNVYIRNNVTNRNHLRKQIEDHYSLIFEPNHLFYTHVTPNKGTAQSIAACICQKLQTDSVDAEKLLFVGCDGTNVNTGLHNGKNSYDF